MKYNKIVHCNITKSTIQYKKKSTNPEFPASLDPSRPRPMAFLSGLLKTAMAVSASSICRADLEKRIGMQLDQAILEDILIAAGAGAGAAAPGGRRAIRGQGGTEGSVERSRRRPRRQEGRGGKER